MMSVYKATILALAIMLIVGTTAYATPLSADDQIPIEQFATYDDTYTGTISHRNWERVLDIMFVGDSDANVLTLEYGRISRQARQVLKQYLSSLQKVPISQYSRKVQLAFWLNFYNAASFSLVIEAGDQLAIQINSPSRNPHRKPSIRMKSLLTKDSGPWHEASFAVEGTNISLTDIEHRIVQAHWNDPNVLYGLSCPVRGCPALMPRPFTAEKLTAQLAAAGQQFVASKRNVTIKRGQLKPSSIYTWHTNILADSNAILEHLRQIGDDQLKRDLAGVSRVKGESFSWTLNGDLPPGGLKPSIGMMNRGFGAQYY